MKAAYILASLLWTLCITSAHAQTVLVTGSNRGIGLEFVKQVFAIYAHVVSFSQHDEGIV